MTPRRGKKTRPWRHGLEAAAVRIALVVLRLVPRFLHGPVAGGLARPLAGFARFRRATVEGNWAIAFGGIAPARRIALWRELYRNSILMLFEMAHQRYPVQSATAAGIECDPALEQFLRKAMHSPRPPVFVTAHYGNWELGAAWVGTMGNGPLAVVYKPLHNPLLDALLLRRRQSSGMLLVPTRGGSPRALPAHMRGGKSVGILSDQDAGRRGIMVPFFGRPASTATGMAALAIRYDRPVVALFCERVGAWRYRLTGGELKADAADPEERARALMAAYHAALEEVIRRSPGQYFWWHRRWKTEPRAHRAVADTPPPPESSSVEDSRPCS
jgi:KDO2-lipid IV(A) lauroyltransferase